MFFNSMYVWLQFRDASAGDDDETRKRDRARHIWSHELYSKNGLPNVANIEKAMAVSEAAGQHGLVYNIYCCCYYIAILCVMITSAQLLTYKSYLEMVSNNLFCCHVGLRS